MQCLPAKRWVYRLALIAAGALSALLSPHAFPAETPEQGVARAVSVQGTVEARRVGQTQWQPVKLNDSFRPGDSIRVGERSRADLQLLNQSVLRLNANSSLTVEAPKEKTTGVVDLLRGAVHFLSRGPNSLEVKTPFTVAGVRGTEFLIDLEPKAALVTVFEGTVVAENAAGSLTLHGGQSAIAEAGKAPVMRIVVRPRDAVQWTLYYPPVIQDRQAPAYKAQTLLAVGAVDEARSEIERALKSAPNNADALSLLSVMTLVQGDKDKALQIAQKAVDAAPQSATALIARSYAQQARFNLEAARADMQKAVEVDPRNALAWARLAELQSSFAEFNKTIVAAQKAAALDPNLALTQTVLGFAYLTSIKIKEARETFEKAIALDQAAPLPRLGLGLAKIRDGELEAGGRDLEVAASLDPNDSLVRSYLGKVYYEEKRIPLDEREYATAKKLDPKDPTPWFYDAIAKQTTNRPVEALQDFEKAIELNDDRAVYRSKLLLDSDSAARSASLARVYGDLGFQQRALVEGWRSVDIDPSNSSAHRFLADSYSALPRHEVARVSELLQSQLLQPLNMTPIQPRLAESNLPLVSRGGPGALSFNEFNPIFNHNGVTVQATGLAGGNSTQGEEGVVAGIFDKVSFSVGASQYKTNGFRTNDDQKDDLANAFVQLQVSPDTSIQAEYRYRHFNRGDLRLRFFENDYSPGERDTDQTNYYRVGLRHNLAPDSIILANVGYQTAKYNVTDNGVTFPLTSFVADETPTATGGEMQHLFRSARFNLVSGAGYFTVNSSIDTTLTFDPLLAFPPAVASTDTSLDHFNIYTYAYIHLPHDVTAIVGASGDNLNSQSQEIGDINQFNPKLGVVWNPVPNTTLRAAAFRTLKRTLIVDQTLEPTQVAGFNQFFDDPNGTQAWNYGGAIDQKFSRGLFAGASVSKRDLTVRYLDLVTDPFNPMGASADWHEDTGRAYLFWTPHDWVALRAEYLYERVKHDPTFTDGFTKLTTKRIPLGANFFHPSGLSAFVTGTHYNQDGSFDGFNTGIPQSGSDSFWLVDAGISYRLPKRYGMLTVGVTNLTDQKFNYFDTDVKNASIQPDRVGFVRLTIALP
jgi:tetratricopeptide (TPR) repeat protein